MSEKQQADYKMMYLTLLDEVEKAIQRLISAQRACEEIYIDTVGEELPETLAPLKVLTKPAPAPENEENETNS